MKPAATPPAEETAEYRHGCYARRRNRPDSDNPYESAKGNSTSRRLWFVGWYDEDTAIFLERQSERRLKETAKAKGE